MSLFDKFKKKENDSTVEPVPTPEQSNVETLDANNNQTAVAEVSVDNNPFSEQVPPTEESNQTEAETPSFDNIFNAQASDLIMSEASTATKVDNPTTIPEQNILSVDPAAVFEGNENNYDAITEIVSEAVNPTTETTPPVATEVQAPAVEETVSVEPVLPVVEQTPVIEKEVIEEPAPAAVAPVEQPVEQIPSNQEVVVEEPKEQVEELVVEAPTVAQPTEPVATQTEVQVTEPVESPVAEVQPAQTVEQPTLNVEPIETETPVAETPQPETVTSEANVASVELPIESTPVQEVATIESVPVSTTDTVSQPEYTEEIQDINVTENFLPPEIAASQLETANTPVEEVTIPIVEEPIFELTNDQIIENPEERSSLPTPEEPSVTETPIETVQVERVETEVAPVAGTPLPETVTSEANVAPVELAVESTPAQEPVPQANTTTLETTESNDNMSILERTNEMILSSILEDNEDESTEATVDQSVATEQPVEQPVIEETAQITPIIEEEQVDLPIIASEEKEAEETTELRPIIEEDETVILPILTQEDIEKYAKEEVKPIIKPIIEEEQDDLNIGAVEETPTEEKTLEPAPSVEDSKETQETNLPVIELTSEAEEKTEETENKDEATEQVTTEEVPTDNPQFDFKPFMNINTPEEEDPDTPTSVTTDIREEIGTYISDPTPTKFCNNCGIMLTDDSSICPSCGEPID